MLIKEYRIPMPMSVEEYRIAQLYMIQIRGMVIESRRAIFLLLGPNFLLLDARFLWLDAHFLLLDARFLWLDAHFLLLDAHFLWLSAHFLTPSSQLRGQIARKAPSSCHDHRTISVEQPGLLWTSCGVPFHWTPDCCPTPTDSPTSTPPYSPSSCKKSREETCGEGSGVEILENRPYTDGPGGSGQYTHKVYHIGMHIPSWFRSILPKAALRVEEESWNAYPYTRTRYTCPFVEKFSIDIETYYMPDTGNQVDVFNLSLAERRQRSLDPIDIVKDPIPPHEYKAEEDPRLYKSVKTQRGPLAEDWIQQFENNPGKMPVMCAYKLCKVEFRYWGMQSKIERFIHDAWCWQDEWYGLTMEDIRQLELETQLMLAQKMAQFSCAEEDGEPNGSAPTPDEAQDAKEAISSPSRHSLCEWRMQSIARDSEDSSDEEFFDAHEDLSDSEEVFPKEITKWSSNDLMDKIEAADTEEAQGELYQESAGEYTTAERGDLLNQICSFASCPADSSAVPAVMVTSPTADGSSQEPLHASKIHVLILVLHGGNILDSGGGDPSSKQGDVNTISTAFETVMRDAVATVIMRANQVYGDFIKSLEGATFSGQVSDFFLFGSPLGLVLALRKTVIPVLDVAQLRPACQQVYNLFHPADPSASRLEPLLEKKFHLLPPFSIPRYQRFPLGDGNSALLVETVQSNPQLLVESGGPLSVRCLEGVSETCIPVPILNWQDGSFKAQPVPPESDVVQSHGGVFVDSSFPSSPCAAPQCQGRRRASEVSIASQVSGMADTYTASNIAHIAARWWGTKRIDFALYCPDALTAFPTVALPHLFHASYWESTDAVSFLLRQVMRHENSSILELDGKEVSEFTPSKPREKWLRKRTHVKIRNVTANHRVNDAVFIEDGQQVVTGRFMYGPLDMSKRLGIGVYPVKMVVRGDHTFADSYLTVLPRGTEFVVFSIDGSFAASVSIMGSDPKVRAGAVDVVRHWQDLGYLIIYVTGRPDMQKQRVVAWLSQHNFPHGIVSFCDGLVHDPLRHKANFLKALISEAHMKVFAGYGSTKDISVYTSIGLAPSNIYIVGRPTKKMQHQCQFITDGYAAHLSQLEYGHRSRPAKPSSGRMVLRKGSFGLGASSDFLRKRNHLLRTISSQPAPGPTHSHGRPERTQSQSESERERVERSQRSMSVAASCWGRSGSTKQEPAAPGHK
ncbi:hypothetical protein JZ751_012983 [Albula glossodonta]|uniref:DDHD domain-containing protein n=1 Tax=Albula glossodonta TaxID=121402 RepID=A0A8T2N698_9TELE|nr:hypothetical protein JZ751_012983 [Albula glossodonta]